MVEVIGRSGVFIALGGMAATLQGASAYVVVPVFAVALLAGAIYARHCSRNPA